MRMHSIRLPAAGQHPSTEKKKKKNSLNIPYILHYSNQPYKNIHEEEENVEYEDKAMETLVLWEFGMRRNLVK